MFEIDKYSRVPIYEQVIERAESLILSGALRANDQFPSVRALSQELNVNPNTLQKAYAELDRRGICYSVPGSGRFISEDALLIIMRKKRTRISEITDLVAQLKSADVSLEEIIQYVISAYEHAKGGTKID